MESRGTVTMTWAAVVILLVTDVLYVVLITSQPPSDNTLTVPFVAGYLALMAVLLALSRRSHPRLLALRTVLRAGPAGGLLLLGTLAAFSIGLPILVAAALAFVIAGRSLPRVGWLPSAATALVAAIVAAAALVVGIDVSQRLIICPPHGTAGGGGSGLVSGPYHYECVNGVLTYHSGS